MVLRGPSPRTGSHPAGGRVRGAAVVGALGVAVLGLQGCAALPVAALGAPMLGAGAGAVVRAGTEYTAGGTVRRTFTIPRAAVRAGVLEAFDRAGVVLEGDEVVEDREHLDGRLRHRTVEVRLTAFSESLTGLTLAVRRPWPFKDRATGSELLSQIERVLAEHAHRP
jgi:hypothetical protein